ncbi:MAG: nickel pincer cofactor biosynthesis protein LarC [Kineosporiaceae bacterium]
MSPSVWIDASAGVAGDMLMGALIDAGASIDSVQEAVEAVLPGAVRLHRSEVRRAGLRATKLDVEVLEGDPPERRWSTIRELISNAALPHPVMQDALSVFGRLAGAEAHVHGTPAEEVHFHEVGGLDSIADIIGVCAALHHLGAHDVHAGVVALGSGEVATRHGTLAVPTPAVLELLRGWPVSSGGSGELATPTGAALISALAVTSDGLPPGRLDGVGIGAGTRDRPGRANVVRVVLTQPDSAAAAAAGSDAVVLEANVDDLDPRLWPGVLTALLDAGADDAWLVPIIMKKGRPAHTLTVLCDPAVAGALRTLMFEHTSTIGVREHPVAKTVLARTWVRVPLDDQSVAIKVAHAQGRIMSATPEFTDVQAVAAELNSTERVVLARAAAAACSAGLVPGAPWPVAGLCVTGQPPR